MTIAEQLKSEIVLQKDIPWLKEEVMSEIRGRGMFSIICDTHIRDITKYAIPYKYNSALREWARQDGLSGTKIQHSILGRIKNKLSMNDRVMILDKWFPTTKYCSKCGNKVELELKDRIFECPNCKTKEDRDIHAANNMIYFYLQYINAPGTDVNMLVGNKVSYKKFVTKQESDTTLVCR